MELVKGVGAFFRNKEVAAANYRWTGRPDPDQTARGMFHSTAFYNPGKWKHAGLEELLEQTVHPVDFSNHNIRVFKEGWIVSAAAPQQLGRAFDPAQGVFDFAS